VLDGGPSPSNLPSTVIDVSTGKVQVVRDGAIDVSEYVG
jgi:tRNA A37 threonylcarbamoyladenosine synthetase subunit TsaC/SUA5/YrdC